MTGLEKFENVIMTPHIGGSTEEAQAAIGMEVSTMMVNFINRAAVWDQLISQKLINVKFMSPRMVTLSVVC